MKSKTDILLVGGSGTLGKELIKHIDCYYPTHEEFDITRVPLNEWIIEPTTKLIVLAAAYTDVVKAEIEKELCYQTNVIGTRNLASLNIPMLYISTEYVFAGEKGNYDEEAMPNPQNFYALTKLLGEYESRRTRSVVVRCLFKPRPFEHLSACIDQFTTGDYVDKIAPHIIYAIKEFDKLPPTIHIGTGRKSIFDLAIQSRPDVKKCRVEDIKTVKLPKDTSLCLNRWEAFKREHPIRTN